MAIDLAHAAGIANCTAQGSWVQKLLCLARNTLQHIHRMQAAQSPCLVDLRQPRQPIIISQPDLLSLWYLPQSWTESLLQSSNHLPILATWASPTSAPGRPPRCCSRSGPLRRPRHWRRIRHRNSTAWTLATPPPSNGRWTTSLYRWEMRRIAALAQSAARRKLNFWQLAAQEVLSSGHKEDFTVSNIKIGLGLFT